MVSTALLPILFPSGSRVPLTLSGNEITPLTRTTATQGDGLTGPYAGSSIGVWEATTNLEANSDAGTNTTGHAAGGTNTMARSTAQKKFGVASFLCTYQDNAVLDSVALTLTAAVHSAKRWLWIPTAYDGTQISVQFSAYASATGTLTADANMALRDQWQEVKVQSVTPNAGDLVGAIIVSESGTPTAGRFIYVGGCQTEQQPICTPNVYTDGGTASRTAARVYIGSASRYLTATQGWVAGLVRWGFATTAEPGAGSGFARLFTWAVDSNNTIHGRYRENGNTWSIQRITGGVGTLATVAAVPSVDGLSLLIAKWTATAISVSIDGGAFTDGADTNIPDLSAQPLIDFGANVGGTAEHLDSNTLFLATGKGTLSNANAAALNNIARNNRIESRLEDLPGGATFKWPSENWREGMAL